MPLPYLLFNSHCIRIFCANVIISSDSNFKLSIHDHFFKFFLMMLKEKKIIKLSIFEALFALIVPMSSRFFIKFNRYAN